MRSLPLSKHLKHAPKHRAAPAPSKLAHAPRAALRTTVVLSSVAVAATGVAVTGGVLGGAAPASVGLATNDRAGSGTEVAAPAARGEIELSTSQTDRRQTLSRSADRRKDADPAKELALGEDAGHTMSGSENLADADPREIGRALLAEFGFGADQFGCLDSLYTRESNWTVNADNPSSSAYGIPQALPGEKMSSAGADWATNPVTQIRWGLGYIQDRYGSPCSAWGHSQAVGWY